MYGSLSSDTIYGDSGNDRLFGAYGHDYLTGGTGKDVFLARVGDFDTVTDFKYDTSAPDENDMVYVWWKTRDNVAVLNPDAADGKPLQSTDADGVIHASYTASGVEFLHMSYDARNGYIYVNGSVVMELLDGFGAHPLLPAELIGISDAGAADNPLPGIFIT